MNMEDNKCCTIDYVAEYHRLIDYNRKLEDELRDIKSFYHGLEEENRMLIGTLEIVHLIFGGKNHG